eukprot:m.221259 g.221259  ORF g.221259 m.221259 type:complete len:207 (+) comp39958_c0_seq2:120-740(+)
MHNGDSNKASVCRGPGLYDQALIAASGTYDVLVDRDTSIASLTIGSGKARIRLVVSSGTTLTVTSTLEAICPTVLILGSLNVSILWSGHYLDGSQTFGYAADSTTGRLTVNKVVLVKLGLYGKKYIRNIVWTSRANFTIGSLEDSYNVHFHCRACRIVNSTSGSMLFNHVKLRQDGQPAPKANGFITGRVNHRIFMLETTSCLSIY